jgi:peptidoglycan L-alanyl-D-glutamate endopeptidase CwlK
MAFDAIPTKTGFADYSQFEAMAKVILEHAKKLGIKIRWGADWNMNGSSKDEKFIDAPHFELV